MIMSIKSSDKYRLFKNFLHNELEISKADIGDWISEAIAEEVQKVVAQSYGKMSIEELVKRAIYSHDMWDGRQLTAEIKAEVAKQILERLDINITEK